MGKDRFGFGANWSNYIKNLSENQIMEAQKSIELYIPSIELSGKTFLDLGCGSGLFSLVAMRLGAKVHSMDYDINSVKCARELKNKYFANNSDWVIEQGDVLDKKYMSGLIKEGYDIVYSWGVLHHTGNMYKAIDNASKCVRPGGVFFISIYNDQGAKSIKWKKIKKYYNKSPRFVRTIIALAYTIYVWGPTIYQDLLKGNPLNSWNSYYKQRGMSPWIDVVDWVGGYPFEVAKPKEITKFCEKRGFKLLKIFICGYGKGCNQYVFKLNEK